MFLSLSFFLNFIILVMAVAHFWTNQSPITVYSFHLHVLRTHLWPHRVYRSFNTFFSVLNLQAVVTTSTGSPKI